MIQGPLRYTGTLLRVKIVVLISSLASQLRLAWPPAHSAKIIRHTYTRRRAMHCHSTGIAQISQCSLQLCIVVCVWKFISQWPRCIKFAFDRKSEKSNANRVLTNQNHALRACVWFFWFAIKRKFLYATGPMMLRSFTPGCVSGNLKKKKKKKKNGIMTVNRL